MNKNNQGLAAVAGLSMVGTDVQIRMEDVASVFLSRYETGLEAERKSLQARLVAATNEIKALVKEAQTNAISFVQASGITKSFDTPLFALTITTIEDPTLDWNKGQAGVTVRTKAESKTRSSGYNRTTEGSVVVDVEVSARIVAEYKEQMSIKAVVTEQLNEVQAKLRNLTSKERQIRGQIAELKLQQLGMTDLLENPQLLALVDLTDGKTIG